MYGSNFASATRKPRASRRAPIEAAAMPFPSEETTPPVTNTYLALIQSLLFCGQSLLNCGGCRPAGPVPASKFGGGCRPVGPVPAALQDLFRPREVRGGIDSNRVCDRVSHPD